MERLFAMLLVNIFFFFRLLEVVTSIYQRNKKSTVFFKSKILSDVLTTVVYIRELKKQRLGKGGGHSSGASSGAVKVSGSLYGVVHNYNLLNCDRKQKLRLKYHLLL